MTKRKRNKNKISDKMLGIMIGIAIAISAAGIISSISVSYAHTDGGTMSGDGMPMMHSMMMGDGMMGHMNMNHDGLTQEEIDEMMEHMDEDGDGLCDHCGMSVEACRMMMDNHNEK